MERNQSTPLHRHTRARTEQSTMHTPPPPLMTAAAGCAPPPPARLQLVRPPPLQAPWSTGLFDCCDDIPICCVTCLCPCITFGQIAEIVDRRSIPCGVSGALYTLMLCVTGCACLYSCFYRSKMRGQLFLEEAPCADCVLHCCCESCALCQEHRELKIRGFFGFDRGWERSMQMQRSVRMLPPAEQGGMQR